MAKQKLEEKELGFAGAVIAAACMLLLGIGWNVGIYVNAAEAMSKWHLFFSSSLIGIVGGMIEAGVWTFITLYIFAYLYNKF